MKLVMIVILGLLSTGLSASTTILFLGDSLSEGLGVDESQSFPRVVEFKLREKKQDVQIINGGVSGATTASGEGRLLWHTKKQVDILILELGANDGLRGLKIADTEKNLKKIIKLAKSKNIKVILLGLLMPPNYGKKYTSDFESMYKNIARSEKILFIPSLLNDVAGRPKYNQADGIHPNALGHELIADKIALFLGKHL